ncbi:Smr domain protein [Bacteriovorax sp. BSW11_IV]|nr:Smr domain protein [Bacteriovorax sp. BSW11_IV]
MSHNLLDNSEFLDLIDWPTVAAKIYQHAHFDFTKDSVLKQLSALDPGEILQNFDNLDYLIANFDLVTQLRLNNLLYMRSALSDNFTAFVQKSNELSLADINQLCLCYELYSDCVKPFAQWSFFEQFTIEQSNKDKIRNKIISTFRKFVTKDGKEELEKHPMLKELFSQLRKTEETLRQQASLGLRSESYAKSLQFEQFDIVADRFVLPIRSDSFKSDFGPIIGRSASGNTLFVEPANLRNLNNTRIELTAKIEGAVSKICRAYTEDIQTYFLDFKKFIDFAKIFDLLYTKAAFSYFNNYVRPQINDSFEFSLHGTFHPLIPNAVKNDVVLTKDRLGIVISGPNTGGKTVALKTVIICHLFTHMGVFLPATDASIYPVKELYFYSHDQQDLNQGLSSFASEAKNYLELLSTIGDNSLIVIDEIFNSTSSEEASALALSFLEKIHAKSDSKVVLSTHHQLFKTHIHSNPMYISAYVGYDMEKQGPTYRLYVGEPGSSMALTIFDNLSRKYGVETDISTNAQKILDKKQLSYEKLLEELSKKKASLDKLLIDNEGLNKELKNQKKSMEGILHLEKERLVLIYEKKIKKLVTQAEDLKERAKKGEFNIGRKFAADSHSVLSGIHHLKDELYEKHDNRPQTKALDLSKLKIGQKIYSAKLKRNVELVSINTRKHELQVKNGNLKIWLPANTFEDLVQKQDKAPPKREVHINIERTTSGQIEIDCRGMRLEEFQRKAETSINEVISGDIPFLTIVHGHGDGILKKWLRKYLSEQVELRYENIDGNDGCTRVYLKN